MSKECLMCGKSIKDTDTYCKVCGLEVENADLALINRRLTVKLEEKNKEIHTLIRALEIACERYDETLRNYERGIYSDNPQKIFDECISQSKYEQKIKNKK